MSGKMGRSSRSGLDGPSLVRDAGTPAGRPASLVMGEAAKVLKIDECYLGADLARIDPLARDLLVLLGGPAGVYDANLTRRIWPSRDRFR